MKFAWPLLEKFRTAHPGCSALVSALPEKNFHSKFQKVVSDVKIHATFYSSSPFIGMAGLTNTSIWRIMFFREFMDVVSFENVKKSLRFIPDHIRTKLLAWASSVELEGIIEVRKIPGLHDGPLKGSRHGQRSIRLSKSFRAIYEERSRGTFNIIDVVEVNKHDY